MDYIYLIILTFLFILAIFDLIVGVSNDAGNFLNAAIGSKAAPMRVILLVAILGILAGTTFSSGMMEIARSGVFYPGQFHFSEMMTIFLAVMITDILLLNTFTSIGLPTSTTVSIVFELLGASVMVAIIKISNSDQTMNDIGTYINSGKSLAIISGILLSVVIAFTIGTIVQFVSRLLFTFNYRSKLKYLGGVWGGFAITFIIYFMIIKGVRGASFMSQDFIEYIEQHAFMILSLSFVGFSLIFQLLIIAFRVNILKLIVLLGTFSVAMAFAGNDLVNFIGVPLAGLESFKTFALDPASDPDQFLMTSLTKPVVTPTYLLLLAGAVMSITLIYSKRSRSVIATAVNLSRQEEGEERFGSTLLSRNLVRLSVNLGEKIDNALPAKVKDFISRRFEADKKIKESDKKEETAFDLVRASVNLVVASILIGFGTSLKLPLSTTYVSFMVAMGTSFADGAWGRESAVYRITGVLSVIGGWFITALFAFGAAMIITLVMLKGGVISIIILILVAVFILFRQQKVFQKREAAKASAISIDDATDTFYNTNVLQKCTDNVLDNLSTVSVLYDRLLQGLFEEDHKSLKEVQSEVDKLNIQTKKLKDNINKVVGKLGEVPVETGYYYVQALDYLREIAHCVNYISEPVYVHINNNHKGLLDEQKEEMTKIIKQTIDLINYILDTIRKAEYSRQEEIIKMQAIVLETIDAARKAQIKRIKGSEAGTKNSLLYFNILAETKNLHLFTVNLFKSHRDFVLFTSGKIQSVKPII